MHSSEKLLYVYTFVEEFDVMTNPSFDLYFYHFLEIQTSIWKLLNLKFD